MTGTTALVIILIYFSVLIGISYMTSRKSTNKSFFTGDRQSPWFLVAFGMIGATLSGITFISIPGSVFGKGLQYMPMVIGFFLGYFIVSYVLIPIYYKYNLTSIYTYLRDRFGTASFKTGAISFLISRIIGASLRLYLVAEVLDIFLFEPTGIPYSIGVLMTILLIWVYTFKSGIKTIVWTDTLQTAAILLAAGATLFYLADVNSGGIAHLWEMASNSDLYNFNGGKLKEGNIWLGIFNGIIFTVAMAGLDQDIMQKNLTCKNKKEAQKNLTWFSIVLVPINFVFLLLGILLFETYMGTGDLKAIVIESTNELGDVVKSGEYRINIDGEMTKIAPDQIYPSLAKNGYFPLWLSGTFLIGLIAAAYSSADSALTSLTTSVCIDIVEKEDRRTRTVVHVLMSVILFFVVMLFKAINKDSIIWELFKWTSFTYGPLLGLFGIGILSKIQVKDTVVPFIAILSAVSSYFMADFFGLGFEILAINGGITALGLLLFKKKKTCEHSASLDE
ncbi:MAG: sodium:solute symporter [Flavobacteriales bacterium]|nr:sodium:solute symporter [Flavobacteriales bacterium]|tara:strand:- start:35302 stop:36816 length:1515 start_codon:yes stop_codon:yes gene_type:complete